MYVHISSIQVLRGSCNVLLKSRKLHSRGTSRDSPTYVEERKLYQALLWQLARTSNPIQMDLNTTGGEGVESIYVTPGSSFFS